MEKIDRLGWAAGLAFTAYGVRVGIRVGETDVLKRVEIYLPPAWSPASSPRVDILYSVVVGGAGSRPGVRRFNLLYANAHRVARSLDLGEVFDAFEAHVHLHIAEAAPRRRFVHAGVVGWRGEAILIPGRSHSGKSTLVAALVAAGATYYSDEYAVLDERGRVHPYPKPLSLRANTGGKATRHPVETLGWSAGSTALPIGLVVVSQYKAGAVWRPRRLSTGHGVLALLANTVSARRQPAVALATLQRVAANAVILKGGRGEASAVAPRLLKYLEKSCNHGDIPGSVLASLLRGIWRHTPPDLATSEDELRQVTPLLLRSGGGALGWHRIRHSSFQTSVAARSLQQAYRLHAVRTAVHEQVLQKLFGALRSAGVEPILIKGWAVARLYPEPGLRPYGDFDIVVRPEQHAAAVTVLNEGKSDECPVDLHCGLGRMHEQSLEALDARSQIAPLDKVDIRILAAEDHLVVLIRHFLRHNAWRPLWLCDIAAGLESRPTDFDWDRCLGGSRRHAGWVACMLGLAHQLLDAHVENTPVANRANHLPNWLVPAVLRQWDRCLGAGERGRVVRYIASNWRHPMQIFGEARERWDMPIAATVALEGSFSEVPRLPFQLGLALSHVPIWCQELGSYVKERCISRMGQ